MDFRYQGIILGKKDVSEADRIYTFYTRESGKIRALGKGVRWPTAKLAGSLESATLSSISLARTRGLGKITGAIVEKNFSELKADPDLSRQALQAFSILEKLTPEQEKEEEIFNLLEEYLEILDRLGGERGKKEMAEAPAIGFFVKLLDLSGYRMEASKCLGCGKRIAPDGNHFIFTTLGVVCPDCHGRERSKVRINPNSIKFIRLALANSLENITKIRLEEPDSRNLRSVIKGSLEWLLERRITI